MEKGMKIQSCNCSCHDIFSVPSHQACLNCHCKDMMYKVKDSGACR